MSTAVFPGSFDPVTKGHMDLIYRASKMFDALVLGVLINSSKKPLLTVEERSAGDFEYELPLAQANYKLNGRADTIFLATSPQYSYVSSSAVKELMRYNADISGYVPMEALKYLNRDK